MTAPSDATRGALLVLAAEALFATSAALIRAVSGELPVEMVVFFRNAFGLLVLSPWVYKALRDQGGGLLRPRAPGFLVLRAVFGLTAMYCFFFALSGMPLAEAVVLKLSAPFFIPFFAALWLGEGVSMRARWAIVIGFAGVMLVLRPGAGLFTWLALAGLGAGMFGAMAKVAVRRAARTESPLAIVVFFAALGALISSVPLIWSWQSPSALAWAGLLAIGAVTSAAQVLLTRGYALAEAAQVGPLTYVAVVVAAGYGWLLWGERPAAASIAGAVLIAVAGVLIMRRGRLPGTPVVE